MAGAYLPAVHLSCMAHHPRIPRGIRAFLAIRAGARNPCAQARRVGPALDPAADPAAMVREYERGNLEHALASARLAERDPKQASISSS